MDDPAWRLDDYSLKPHSVDTDMVDHQDYALVVTGDVFRWMINNAPFETLQRVCFACTHVGLLF
jgi:cation-transporting ATPase 13A3/4/5